MLEIKAIHTLTTQVVEGFSLLLPQLDAQSTPPTTERIAQLLQQNNTYIYGAFCPQMVGSLTLVVVHTPSGSKAWIEDVVVDEASRGKGIASALITKAIDQCKSLQVHSLNLTSMPQRQAANRLYQKLGFVLRDTNVYRLYL